MKDDLAPVELATQPPVKSSFFIDSASPSSFALTVAMLGGFFLLHLSVAWCAPAIFSENQKYIKLNLTETNATIELDVTLDHLDPAH
jgi:hypothetical protein